MMKVFIFLPFLVALVHLTRAQLSLPEMPGPPYPDKFGNNRWGVKYDPRVHGRGRNQHGSSSTSGEWGGGGGDAPQYSPGGARYRGGDGNGASSPPRTRSKWAAALRPLVSRTRLSKHKSKRNRRPSGLKSSSSFDPTSDSFYKNPYSSKSIDGYVKNYLNTYNKVSQTSPVSSSGILNIEDFVRPTRKFRQRNFGRGGNRRSHTHDESSTGSLSDIYVRAADNKARYRTLNPQTDFFGPQISKKKSDFAKTLVNIYNDYKPSENAVSGISSGNSAGSISAASSDSYSNSLPSRSPNHPHPPRRSRPPPPPGSGPNYVERPFYSSGSSSSKRPRGPPYSPRGPPPSSSYSSSRPLSSIDLHDDIPSYSSNRGPPPSSPYEIEYSDSPVGITSGGPGSSFGSSYGSGSYSSSGPVSLSAYMPGPPPSSLYSSSPDSFGLSEQGPFSPFSSPLGGAPPPPPPPIGSPYVSPVAPLSIAPAQLNYLPNSGVYLSPLLYTKSNSAFDDKHKKSKRKKKRLQHTPMNVLRGLLGRGERRDRYRDHDDDSRDTYKPAFAVNYPITLPAPAGPPPQYAYNPIVNSLTSSPLDFDGYSAGPPPPPPPPPLSPLAAGLSTLRDTLTGYRDRPYYHRHPPPPPPPRYPSEDNKDSPREPSKEGAPNPSGPGPITQHMQDWPRIFTAMGTSVDAVAGGIHAVRKEISKMTGQTVAKGILMGGSAVHEVTKGMAHVISKMSSI